MTGAVTVKAGSGEHGRGHGDPPDVRLVGLVKRFGDTTVGPLDLEVRRGEFFSLLGPSGCGKTTTLRMVAGFEEPSEGRVELRGQDVTDLPPYERATNTVFQDYALFPHMNVFENVAYGLRVRRRPRAEVADQVEEALRTVRLEQFGRRRPSQLSGGQRQRVALARALVLRPAVLLLDEPLGALDLKLRQEMQLELKAIQEQVGITFVYVTHDQEEALTMSDRMAVLSAGRVEQVGTPTEIYERPATSFVAGFIGVSNLLRGEVAGVRDGLAAVRLGVGGEALVAAGSLADAAPGTAVTLTVRPEKLAMLGVDEPAPAGRSTAVGVVDQVAYLGVTTKYVVLLDDGEKLVVIRQNATAAAGDLRAEVGRRVRLVWDPRFTYPVRE